LKLSFYISLSGGINWFKGLFLLFSNAASNIMTTANDVEDNEVDASFHTNLDANNVIIDRPMAKDLNAIITIRSLMDDGMNQDDAGTTKNTCWIDGI
jgi:hypothetical protein